MPGYIVSLHMFVITSGVCWLVPCRGMTFRFMWCSPLTSDTTDRNRRAVRCRILDVDVETILGLEWLQSRLGTVLYSERAVLQTQREQVNDD